MMKWRIVFVFIPVWLCALILEANDGARPKLRRESILTGSSGHATLRHSASLLRHMIVHENGSDNVLGTNGSGNNALLPAYVPLLPSQEFDTHPAVRFHKLGTLNSTHATQDGANCPRDVPCAALDVDCIDCHFNYSCVYGEEMVVQCKPKKLVQCQGSQHLERKTRCRYCYQTEENEHSCIKNTTCRVVVSPRQRYVAKCEANRNVLCLGSRVFAKNLLCNWTKGYSWSTALFLSVTLGGFGVDRFYLGMWQEGIGKLFSFGGLGVWTLVDVVLIATGYLGPADGSLYIP